MSHSAFEQEFHQKLGLQPLDVATEKRTFPYANTKDGKQTYSAAVPLEDASTVLKQWNTESHTENPREELADTVVVMQERVTTLRSVVDQVERMLQEFKGQLESAQQNLDAAVERAKKDNEARITQAADPFRRSENTPQETLRPLPPIPAGLSLEAEGLSEMGLIPVEDPQSVVDSLISPPTETVRLVPSRDPLFEDDAVIEPVLPALDPDMERDIPVNVVPRADVLDTASQLNTWNSQPEAATSAQVEERPFYDVKAMLAQYRQQFSENGGFKLPSLGTFGGTRRGRGATSFIKR